MKFVVACEISEFEENAISRSLLRGRPVTEKFMQTFTQNALQRSLNEISNEFIEDTLTTQVMVKLEEP